MEKICRKCGEKFIAKSWNQIYCEECKKTLKCCIEGCEKKVRYPSLCLCKHHYRNLKNNKESGRKKINCNNCNNLFISKSGHEKYCNDCKDNLKCCVEGCKNKVYYTSSLLCKHHYNLKHRNKNEPGHDIKNCKNCNKEFKPNSGTQIYCEDCYMWNRKRLAKKRVKNYKEIKCLICGTKFVPRAKNHIFCSKGCRDINSKCIKEKIYNEIIKPNGTTKCGRSFPQMFIYNIIKNNFLNFEWKYDKRNILINPITNKSLEIDIWCKDKNIAIEYDGECHFAPIFGVKSFEKTKILDKLKNELCKEKGIKLIRISNKDNWKNKEWIINKVKEAIDGNY